MDVKKVLQDLMARSERTTFENEREVCLEKIQDEIEEANQVLYIAKISWLNKEENVEE